MERHQNQPRINAKKGGKSVKFVAEKSKTGSRHPGLLGRWCVTDLSEGVRKCNQLYKAKPWNNR